VAKENLWIAIGPSKEVRLEAEAVILITPNPEPGEVALVVLIHP